MEAWHQSLRLRRAFDITSRRCSSVLFLEEPPTSLNQLIHQLADLAFSVPALLLDGGAGILTGFPSATPFGCTLGPTYPARMILGQETLGFRREGFSPSLSLLTSAFSLPTSPRSLTLPLHPGWNAPLPILRCYGFGTTLSPVIFTARDNSISELLRFL